jgi:hypothetical protein
LPETGYITLKTLQDPGRGLWWGSRCIERQVQEAKDRRSGAHCVAMRASCRRGLQRQCEHLADVKIANVHVGNLGGAPRRWGRIDGRNVEWRERTPGTLACRSALVSLSLFLMSSM